MNGFPTIFKVIGKNHTTGKHYFEKCFKSLAGAQADIDSRIKKASALRLKLLADLWRNDNEKDCVHCYRLVKVSTPDNEELWFQIEAGNLYP